MQLRRLSDVSNVVMGISPPGDTYNTDGVGVPLLNGPTEFGNSHPQCSVFTTSPLRICDQYDLLFCVRGSTTGKMNIADRPYALGRGVCAIHCETPSETQFLRYAIEHRLHQLLQVAGGGTFPNLSKNDLLSLDIPWPSDRIRIASRLSTMEVADVNNLARIRVLEEIAKLIFQRNFNKMLPSKHPTQNSTRETSAPTSDRWPTGKIGDLFTLQRGYDLSTADRRVGPYPIVSSSGVTGSHDEYRAISPGVVTGRYGTLGKVFMLHEPYWPLNTSLFISDFLGSDPYFAHQTLSHLDLETLSTAGAIPGINRAAVHSVICSIPPIELRREYGKHVEPMYRQIHTLERSSRALRAARDLLLPKLLSGQLSVDRIPDPAAVAP